MKHSTVTLESMSQAVWYNNWTFKKFALFLDGDILEVGCGIGNFTPVLSKYGKVWAIDINDNYIRQIKKEQGGEIKAGKGDIEKGEYFFGDKKFDSIVCLNVLEHIRDDNAALKNLFSLLKSGGRLILLVPAHQFLYGNIDKEIDHFRRYPKREIVSRLKGCGFKIIKSQRFNFPGALGWFIAGKIFKKNAVEESNISIFNRIAPFILPLEIFEPPIGISVLVVAKK